MCAISLYPDSLCLSQPLPERGNSLGPLGSLGRGFESCLPLPRRVTLTRHFPSLSRFLLCGSEKTHPGQGVLSAGAQPLCAAGPARVSAPCVRPSRGLSLAGGGSRGAGSARRGTECASRAVPAPCPSRGAERPGETRRDRGKETRRLRIDADTRPEPGPGGGGQPGSPFSPTPWAGLWVGNKPGELGE